MTRPTPPRVPPAVFRIRPTDFRRGPLLLNEQSPAPASGSDQRDYYHVSDGIPERPANGLPRPGLARSQAFPNNRDGAMPTPVNPALMDNWTTPAPSAEGENDER